MGFRFRKNFNLGGGFRGTISKSGVGYSWGTKGIRLTKKAGGGTRTTLSIPGTGISYVSDSKKRRKGNSTGTSGAGCLALLLIWPIKLCWWMIIASFWLTWQMCYWMIVLCFIWPIKWIIRLIKTKAHQPADIDTTQREL